MKKLFAFLIAFRLLIMPLNAQASIVNQVTGIAIAAVGVSAATSCVPLWPSMWTYIGGAGAYLLGEMNAANTHSRNTTNFDDSVKRLQESGVRGGELQLATIDLQLQQKKEDKKLADQRKTWATAAAVAFTAAAVLAATEIPIPPLMPLYGISACTASPQSPLLAAGVVGAYTFLTNQNLLSGLLGAVAGAVGVAELSKLSWTTGPTRSIAFGASAALVTLAATDAGNAASKLQNEIDALEIVKRQMIAETNGKGPNTEDTNTRPVDGLNGTTRELSVADPARLVGLPTGAASRAANINCLSSKQELGSNCSSPMTFSAPNVSGLGNGPELQKVANQTAEFANAAARGDIAKADIAAASLAAKAGRLNELLKKTRADANKKLIAEGKKPIDYEKEEKDLLNSMESSYQKETAGKQQQLAALGLDKLSLEPSKLDGSGQNILGANSGAVAAVPTSKGDAASAVADQSGLENLADPNATNNENGPSLSARDALGKNLNQYESAESDISKNSGESLWKQVSNRYFLNYEKIFERKKLPEKAPAQ